MGKLLGIAVKRRDWNLAIQDAAMTVTHFGTAQENLYGHGSWKRSEVFQEACEIAMSWGGSTTLRRIYYICDQIISYVDLLAVDYGYRGFCPE